MCAPLADLAVNHFTADQTALFLDFDGTLVALTDHPDDIRIEDGVKAVLLALSARLGGALAIISGRSIGDLDRHLALPDLPLAGVHGLERRDFNGKLHLAEIDEAKLHAARDRLSRAVGGQEGLLVEEKPGSLALHFRKRPELAVFSRSAMKKAVRDCPEFSLIDGKMVIEAKLGTRNKAAALADFMREAPFAGRQPVYAGDDRTDEDAFIAARQLGGIAIKIGSGETAAHYRAAGTSQFTGWLRTLAESLDSNRLSQMGET